MQGDRSQPELGLLAVASHVDVHRLVAVKTVEEEPDGPGMPGIFGTSCSSSAGSSQAPGNLPSPANVLRFSRGGVMIVTAAAGCNDGMDSSRFCRGIIAANCG
jgi:hypothetical protein